MNAFFILRKKQKGKKIKNKVYVNIKYKVFLEQGTKILHCYILLYEYAILTYTSFILSDTYDTVNIVIIFQIHIISFSKYLEKF